MTYFYVTLPPTQPNPPPHPSIPNHLFAFLVRKKAVDGKNLNISQIFIFLNQLTYCLKMQILFHYEALM
jgi:hypothetical protein